MLNRKELKAFLSVTGFNIWQAEKDYLQHLFLLFLSRRTSTLVFKGGTALQKAYGLNRFSIDLDFTAQNREAGNAVKGVQEDVQRFGFEAVLQTVRTPGMAFSLAVKGPLYDGTARTLSALKIDISLREQLLLPPAAREIVPPYTDLQPYTLLIMNPEEMLAEKIRAIFSRNKARDVYDLWFLLKKGVRFRKALANRKLAWYKEAFTTEKFKKAVSAKKRVWEPELGPLLAAVPDYKEVSDVVISHCRP